MKKLLISILAIVLLMSASSCKKQSVLDHDDSESLLIYEDTVLMDVGYLRQLMTEQNVSADILGTDVLSEKDLFKHEAEIRILSHIAEIYKVNYDKAEVAIEYDDHMEEIADVTSYPGQLEYFNTLRDALGLTPEALKEFVVTETYHNYNVTKLLDDISQSYQFVTDKDILLEYLQSNILEFMETTDIKINYPGVKLSQLDFMDVLEEH